jgi:hypothetical protein
MTDQQQEAEIPVVGGEELPLDEPLDEPLDDQPLTEEPVPKEKKKKKKTVEITYEEYEAIKLAIARHLQALESEGGDNLTWDQVVEWYLDECRGKSKIGESVDEIEEMKMKTDLVIKNAMAAEEVLVSVGVAPAHKKERGKTVLAVHPDYVVPEINEDDEYVGMDIEEGTYLEDEYDDEYDEDREGDFYTYEDLEEYAEKLEKSKDFLLEAGERRSSLLRLAFACCCCGSLSLLLLPLFFSQETIPTLRLPRSRLFDPQLQQFPKAPPWCLQLLPRHRYPLLYLLHQL